MSVDRGDYSADEQRHSQEESLEIHLVHCRISGDIYAASQDSFLPHNQASQSASLYATSYARLIDDEKRYSLDCCTPEIFSQE